MASNRRARRPRSDDSEELGRNRGNVASDGDGDDDEEQESGKSGDTAISAESKEMPRKGAEQPSSPSPKDAGAQGSGEASPARRGGVAMKTKTTTAKRLKKRLPAVPEEDEAEDSGEASPVTPEEDEAEDSGDDASPSPARGPPPEDSADAGRKIAATAKRGEKRSPLPRQEEAERPNKRAAGAEAETVTVDVSAPHRKKKNKRSADKDRRKKKKKKQLKMALTKPTSKKKKQLEKALTQPTSPPQFLESGLNANREDTPSSPDIAQEDEHHGREKAEQEPSNTSLPRDKDMHRAHGQEQQEHEVANQEHGDEEEQLEEGFPQQGQLIDTSPPQEKNRDLEDEETGAQVNGKALQGRIAPSTKPHGCETEKKPAVERSWSYNDELKILNALVAHARSHDGALPDPSHLLANITFDKIDANEEKLADKIRKLKTRYRRFLLQGCRPSDGPARRLFKLCEIVWGQVAGDERVEPTSRDLSVLSNLYPHLAKEVKGYAEAHHPGDFIMAIFTTIGDEKARDLDAKCKKQQIEALKLELGQASLINELLSALSSLPRAKF